MYPKSKKTDSGPSDDDGDEGGGVDDDEESEEEVEHHHHHPWWSTMHARPSHPSPACTSVHSFHNKYIINPVHHVHCTKRHHEGRITMSFYFPYICKG